MASSLNDCLGRDDRTRLIAEIFQICERSHIGLLDAVPKPPLEGSRNQEEGASRSSRRNFRTVASDPVPTDKHFVRKQHDKRLNLPDVSNGRKRHVRKERHSPQRNKPSMNRRTGASSQKLRSNPPFETVYSFGSASTELLSNTTTNQKPRDERVEAVVDDMSHKRDDFLTAGWNYGKTRSVGSNFNEDLILPNSPTKVPKGILKSTFLLESPNVHSCGVDHIYDPLLSRISPRGVDSSLTPKGTYVTERTCRWRVDSQYSPPAKLPQRAKSPSTHGRTNRHCGSHCGQRIEPEQRMTASNNDQSSSPERRRRRAVSEGSRTCRRSSTSKRRVKVSHRSLSPRYTPSRRYRNPARDSLQSAEHSLSPRGRERQRTRTSFTAQGLSRSSPSSRSTPRERKNDYRNARVPHIDVVSSRRKGRRRNRMFHAEGCVPNEECRRSDESTRLTSISNEYRRRTHDPARSSPLTRRSQILVNRAKFKPRDGPLPAAKGACIQERQQLSHS
jgi:hypothetical protein